MLFDYAFLFKSKRDCAEIKRICNKILIEQSFVIKGKCNEDNSIIATKNNRVLFINSFSPTVKINICENNSVTTVGVNFQLKPAVKVLLCIYTIVAIVFEICLINLYLQNDLTSPFLLLLPFLLVLYVLIMSYLGFYMVCRPIKKSLMALGGNKEADLFSLEVKDDLV